MFHSSKQIPLFPPNIVAETTAFSSVNLLIFQTFKNEKRFRSNDPKLYVIPRAVIGTESGKAAVGSIFGSLIFLRGNKASLNSRAADALSSYAYW